jgi:hypothetical protein
MASIVRARVNSEDEKKSTVQVPAGAYNAALIFMEPATLRRGFDEPQDTVRWRLSVEATIEIAAPAPGPREDYRSSLATITLPPVHHARQAVAIWYWPISIQKGVTGRVTALVFRWESDAALASADVLILATGSPAGPMTGLCGLFALPFPGPTEILQPFGRTGK